MARRLGKAKEMTDIVNQRGAVDAQLNRYKQMLEDSVDIGKMEALIDAIGKDVFLAWRDEYGMDALHHAIMANNPQAVDILLKLGYFARPHQPEASLYSHFAAVLGFRTCLNVLLTHRPDDYCIAKQPLVVPPSALARANIGGKGIKSNSSPASGHGTPLKMSPLTSTVSFGGRRGSDDTDRSAGFPGSGLSPAASKTNRLASKPGTRSPARRDSTGSGTKTPDRNGLAMIMPFSIVPGSPKSAQRPRADSDAPPVDDYLQSRQSYVSGRPSVFSSGFKMPKYVSQDSDESGEDFDDKTAPLLKTPLEVAALAGNLDCVRLILDVCVLRANPDAPNKGYLTLASLADCPEALTLLLDTSEKKSGDRRDKKLDTLKEDDLKTAVEICVQRARPQCLDLLLANAFADVKGLFKKINFYHVMYTFSASYGKGAYGRLPAATRVLIKHKHDVLAKIPPRTYPLYTLITHAFCYHEYAFTEFYIESMKLLLEAGADPNFDEVKFEKQLLEKKGIRFAAGRNAYSSALHCLLETVETYASQTSPSLAVKFIEDCADLFVRYSAQVNKVGRIGDARSDLQGNVLHQYAKSAVSLGVDVSVIRAILRYGAEPGIKVKGKYAINVYFDVLFEALSQCQLIGTSQKLEKDVHVMLDCLCDYMTPSEIKDAHFIFNHCHGHATSDQVKPYVRMVGAELRRRSRIVRSLRSLAAWRVWTLCGKKAQVVRELPVKVEIKTLILPLVS